MDLLFQRISVLSLVSYITDEHSSASISRPTVPVSVDEDRRVSTVPVPVGEDRLVSTINITVGKYIVVSTVPVFVGE